MKNLVLIDFTEESKHALKYAIEFTKSINGTLELVNVCDYHDFSRSYTALEELRNRFSTDDFQLTINELFGKVEEDLPKYVNNDKIGFIFCGTHDIKFLERVFSSRILRLMNHMHANVVFIPPTLEIFRPVKHVLAPILMDKHSLQKLEVLRYLRNFMEFELTLCTHRDEKVDINQQLFMAKRILDKAGIPFEIKYISNSESDLKREIDEYAETIHADLISIVNFTESQIFNFTTKGFVEGLIRNKHKIPILAVQNKSLEEYSGFHTAGGY